jgi:tRNA(fMet)-specific endonuclease VapC
VSVFVLDTDILSLYQFGHLQVCKHVAARSASDLAITVISVEEQLGGWYTLLRNTTQRDQVAIAYQSLADNIPFLAKFNILSYSVPSQLQFENLVTMKLNVRKMDLRIAAIALEHGATVVSRNVRDFQRVPGLAIEDWSV